MFSVNSRRGQFLALACLLAGLLFLVYLLTYSGAPLTDDERRIIDTTDSFSRGTLLLNQTSYLDGLQRTSVEPAQPLLSLPLYWLAYRLPWVGNIHALYLFAPLVTALTAAVLFAFASDLGYSARTAVIAALLYGLATVAWPYTKTYFREPLTTLLIFSAAFLANRWRKVFESGSRRHWWVMGALVGATLLALLAKEASIIALPVLTAYAIPRLDFLARRRRQILIIAVTLAVIAGFFAAAVTILPDLTWSLSSRYDFASRFDRFLAGVTGAGPGILGYLFSPGKSIWWFSPVLLMALASPWMLPRRRWRESWLPLALLVLYVVLYASIRGAQWQGGTGWGTRYMVPLTPFLMLAALPVIDWSLEHGGLAGRLGLAGLAAFSFAIQVAGVVVDLFNYEHFLVQQTGLPPFSPGIVWSVRWSQAIGSLLYLGQAHTNIRWFIFGTDWWMVGVLAALIVGLGAGLIWQLRHGLLPSRLLVIGVPLLMVAASGMVLVRAYDDPRYLAERPDLAELRQYLADHTTRDDVILLAAPGYAAHFMNYYKGSAVWYSLPPAPGERYSPDQEPTIISDDVEEQLGVEGKVLIELFSYGREFSHGDHPIWLIGDLTPGEHPWSNRPAEYYLTTQTYRITAIDFSDRARLTEYLPYRHNPDKRSVKELLNRQFGEAIRLIGFNSVTRGKNPLSNEVAAGDPIGIGVLWEVLDTPELDFTVATFIIGPDGLPVLQQDTMPQGGFYPTNTWIPGETIYDCYGFWLPDDLAPGEYQIWLVVYDWRSGERLPVTGPDRESIGDHAVLQTFEVRPASNP